VDKAVNETMGVLSDAHQLIGQAKNEIDALKLQEKADRTDILLKDIDKKAKVITNELQDTSEHLRVTSENLQKLSDNLTKKSVGAHFLETGAAAKSDGIIPFLNQR
jgi:hypothetical protein